MTYFPLSNTSAFAFCCNMILSCGYCCRLLVDAVREQHHDIIQKLGDAGCDLDMHEHERSQTAIHIAVSLGKIRVNRLFDQ